MAIKTHKTNTSCMARTDGSEQKIKRKVTVYGEVFFVDEASYGAYVCIKDKQKFLPFQAIFRLRCKKDSLISSNWGMTLN